MTERDRILLSLSPAELLLYHALPDAPAPLESAWWGGAGTGAREVTPARRGWPPEPPEPGQVAERQRDRERKVRKRMQGRAEAKAITPNAA